jgi:hypothetical protein
VLPTSAAGAFLYSAWQQSNFARQGTPAADDDRQCCNLPPLELLFNSIADDPFLEVQRRHETQQQQHEEDEEEEAEGTETGPLRSSFEVVLLVMPLLLMYHRHTAARVELTTRGAATVPAADAEAVADARVMVAVAAPQGPLAGAGLPATAVWGAKRLDGLAVASHSISSSHGKGLHAVALD